jgi:hypothetical protein
MREDSIGGKQKKTRKEGKTGKMAEGGTECEAFVRTASRPVRVARLESGLPSPRRKPGSRVVAGAMSQNGILKRHCWEVIAITSWKKDC